MVWPRSFPFTTLFLLLCGSVVIHVYMPFYAGVNSQQLLDARYLLEGKKLYKDIVEVNPPLILWINTIFESVALHLKISDISVLVSIGLCVVLFSIWISVKIITLHPAFKNDVMRAGFGLLLAYVFIFWFSTSFFFDREHMFLVLTFPYLLRWMPSLSRAAIPLPLKVTIGCMGALGFCMKPYCIVLFLGIQCMCIFEQRSARILASTENIIIYVGGLCYLSAIWVFTPEYFTIIMPLAYLTYGYSGDKIRGLFFTVGPIALLAIAFADFRWRAKSPFRIDIYYLAGACICMFAYGFANNGWAYTYDPFSSMVLITCAWIGWEYNYLRKQASAAPDGKPKIRDVSGYYGCMAVFASSTLFILFYCYLKLSIPCDEIFACRIERQLAAELMQRNIHSFGALFLQERYGLATESNSIEVTRFNEGEPWMMAPSYTGKHIAQGAWIPAYVADALANDLNRNAPEIVFVSFSIYNAKKHDFLDIIQYYKKFPAFKNAWLHYSYSHTVSAYTDPKENFAKWAVEKNTAFKYDVYLRSPGLGQSSNGSKPASASKNP